MQEEGNELKAADVMDPSRLDAIGRFIVCFSTMENAIRFLLGVTLKLDMDTLYIVTRSYDFATLCNVTKSVARAKNVLPLKADRLDKLISECLDINNTRVRIAHGTWEDEGAVHMARNSHVVKTYFADIKDIVEVYQKSIDITLEINSITRDTFESLRVGELREF